jgi:hypothetical protein
MRRSRLASRLQRMTALLLCVTLSLAGLATAARATRTPAHAAAPLTFAAGHGQLDSRNHGPSSVCIHGTRRRWTRAGAAW